MKTLTIQLFTILGFALASSLGSFAREADVKTILADAGLRSIGKADGVAIWANSKNPEKSMIIGADTSKGLGTWDLKGELIEVINFGGGGASGVNVRDDFPLGGKKVPIVISGNAPQTTLRFFTIDPDTQLMREVTGKRAKLGVDAYGICCYRSPKTGKFYAFVTSRPGLMEQWEFADNGHGKVDAALVREMNIIQSADDKSFPKIEACIADDKKGHIYVAQEIECKVWRYGAEPEDGDARELIFDERFHEEDNIEGLAIYHLSKNKGYFVVSFQNSWKYNVYKLGGNYDYIGTFDLKTVDGAAIEAHDCIDVVNTPLGPDFPKGLMVTQNGAHECGRQFQIVAWDKVADAFSLKLNTDYNPQR